jgi:hypothetical protein
MRAWNILAIAALSDKADTFWATQLFKQLEAFSVTHLHTLSPYIRAAGPVSDSASADINQGYVGIKLWLMLAKRCEEAGQTGEPAYDAVWNELWPPIESIVNILEAEAQNGISPVSSDFLCGVNAQFSCVLDYGRFHSELDNRFILVHQNSTNIPEPSDIGTKKYA